jgi:hypothetical protein
VTRIVSTALVVFLLAGTAGAFAITERLKLVPSPVTGPRIQYPVFSPVCDCEKERNEIAFRLRGGDRVSVAIVDGDGEVVRTLVRSERHEPGMVETVWDGRDDAGAIVPEGVYNPRVHLADERRTIVLPNPIEVDTTPPEVTLVDVSPEVISPDGDGRNDRAVVRYELGEPARAMLFVNGERRERKRFLRPLRGTFEWLGRIEGTAGAPPGRYRITVAAEDQAGNVSAHTPPAWIEVRYVSLAPNRIQVVAGRRFGITIRTDAPRVQWRIGSRTGTAGPGRLVLQAPQRPGAYTFTVENGERRAHARVLVQGP